MTGHSIYLALTGFGRTPDEAMASFWQCLTAYFNLAETDGILETIMAETGGIKAMKQPYVSQNGTFSTRMQYRRGQNAPVALAT